MKGKEILLSHGSGGKLSHNLVNEIFLKAFSNPLLNGLNDSAVFDIGSKKLAFTTDSYTVKPLFFPGGDIGKLAVCGTVNDLAVCGAKPLYISCGFIIEEGFSTDLLAKIAASMKKAASISGVKIVTGDTKVVEKGSADGIFINTAGIGKVENNIKLSLDNIRPGDKIIVNGSIGDHGISVIQARQGFSPGKQVKSDCAPLTGLIQKAIILCNGVKFMRDPTRGGLATVLNEIVEGRNFGIDISEVHVPVKEDVRVFCEVLGFDPLYVANEGKVVMICAEKDAGRILKIMKSHPLGRESRVIGEVVKEQKGRVVLSTSVGGKRILDMLAGEQFPRIC